MLPYWNPYREDGSIASQGDGSWTGTGVNPLEYMANNPVKNKKYKLISTIYGEVTPVENLTIRAQLGVDFSHSTGFGQSYPSYIINNGDGSAGRSSTDILNLTETTTINYRLNITEITISISWWDRKAWTIPPKGSRFGPPVRRTTTSRTYRRARALRAGTTPPRRMPIFRFSAVPNTTIGTATTPTSRCAPTLRRVSAGTTRWAGFWSLGLMWNARQERFLQNVDWLTNAQVAFSTGTSGNSSIPNFDHLALVSGGPNYDGSAGTYPSQSGNESLTWEKTWSTNLALRLGFFDRANLEVEFYNKKTTDMLMLVPESYGVTGEGQYWDNIGAMVNRGVEINVNGDVFRTKTSSGI